MGFNRRRKSFYNILSGIMGQAVAIILGIVIPRLFLVNYGSEINGLLSSVGQIYTYLALLEAGVGTATLQALYGPVATDDKKKISEIISATNIFYRRTGTVYLLAIFAMSILYPIMLNTSIEYITIVVIFVINGIPGVVNFYLQGKYTILLQSEGKQYILTSLATVVNIFVNLSKIVLMYVGANIIVVQAGYLLFNLLQMIVIMIYIKRHYRWIDLNAKPDFVSIGQKNSVLVQQICDLIFRNTDILILTLFCDLKVVSIYSIYTMLFSMISTFLNSFSQGFSFVLGQLFNTNRKRYIELHDAYETYRITLVFALYCIADIFILPFLELYTKGVSDINYIDKWLPILFIMTYLLSCGRANSAAVINYAQHFKETRVQAIVEAVINITVSLISVNIYGIYGVLFGTIAALLYRSNDMIIYANVKILQRSPWRTYKCWIINMSVYIVLKMLYSQQNMVLDTYVQIIGWAGIISVITVVIFFITASLFNKDALSIAIEVLHDMKKKKRV